MSTPAEDEARRQAARILQGPAYQPARSPKPFRGMLHAIGGWLRPVLEPVWRVLGPVWESNAGRIALAVLVVAASSLLTLRVARRRSVRAIARAGRLGIEAGDDPDALERAAEAAERAGDLAAAVRLLFRAGLLRLDRAGRVELTPSTTVDSVRADLRSRPFEPVSRDFEEVAYGARDATEDDIIRARSAWPLVLAGERES